MNFNVSNLVSLKGGSYISIYGQFIEKIVVNNSYNYENFNFKTIYKCKFLINDNKTFKTNAIFKSQNLILCPIPDMTSVTESDFVAFINNEKDKIKLIISQINGLFDNNIFYFLFINEIPELFSVNPNYSLQNIKEGVSIKGKNFQNTKGLKAKFTFTAYDAFNSNKVYKNFEIFIKPIFIDTNTLFINFPNLEFVKYNFILPVKTKMFITNNDLEFSSNYLEFQILKYPRVKRIFPKM